MFTVRPARSDEGEVLGSLHHALRTAAIPAIPPSPHSEEATRRWFATQVLPGSEVWVAEADGRAIAVMVLRDDWLDQLYVDPDWTGRGVGGRLLDLAKARRPAGLQLWAFESNLGARRFYERHGFMPVERTDGSGNEERAADIRYVWPAPGPRGDDAAMTRSPVTYRPLGHDDASFAARAATAAIPHHPVLADEMLMRWQSTEEGADVKRWIVQRQDAPIGWMSVVMPRGGDRQAYVNVILPGIDVLLHEEVFARGEESARRIGASGVMSDLWDDQRAAIEAAGRRGWKQRRRQRYWRLQVAPAAERLRSEHAAALARAAGQGFVLVTAADLGGEAGYPRLHEINMRTGEDIPSSTAFSPEPWESWRMWMRPPYAQPDRVWIAARGGEPVGYSFLGFRSSGLVDTGYTGVLREHRGLGLARALKLATLVQAVDLGVEAVETDNDSENAPIIHLNQALGYSEIPGQVQLARPLHPA